MTLHFFQAIWSYIFYKVELEFLQAKHISTTQSLPHQLLLWLRFYNQIVPQNYFQNATTTSQNINLAYGYLWWLNGKTSYHLPQSQLQFNGTLIPSAPSDMYCALGKNDQKIYVVPSKKLVIIRMGDVADGENFA